MTRITKFAFMIFILLNLCACTFVPYRVMIMDFDNNTNLRECEYLSRSIPEFLISTLGNEEICQLLERQDLQNYYRNFEPEPNADQKWNRLKHFAEEINADYLVVGSISKLDENYILQARLFSSSYGAIVPGSSVWQSCSSQKEIFDKVRYIGKFLAYQMGEQ